MKASEQKAVLLGLYQRLRRDRRLVYGLYLLLLLGLLWAYMHLKDRGEPSKNANTDAKITSAVQTDLEERLGEILSSIRGAGQVEVLITYETGVQKVPVMETDQKDSLTESESSLNRSSTQSESPAILGGEALVLTERQPEVRGVLVVAEGAADPAVRIRLQSAVETVLGIGSGQVEVLEMKHTSMEEGET